jgi:hypothetical protein
MVRQLSAGMRGKLSALMPIVPKKNDLMIQFYSDRQAGWLTNQTAIGLTSGQNTTLDARISTANDAAAAQAAAKIAAKNATVTYHEAANDLRSFGAELIAAIKAKALSVGGDSVYTLASIPPPATPTPRPAPGQPTEIKAVLTPLGEVEMTWKCVNSPGGGTIYNVFRYAGGGTPTPADWTYVGGTGEREITDATPPAGAALIMYKIQAVRSTVVGPWAVVNVFMGVASGGGAMITSVMDASPKAPKMAA